jgi:hypothetical protein
MVAFLVSSTIYKAKVMRWAAHMARMGEKRNASGFWSEGLKEGDHLEDQV